jgi:hypothetical protein
VSDDGSGDVPKRSNVGRFLPGSSGNPRGRPSKIERSITRRQQRRDALLALEEPVQVTRKGRRITMSYNEALLEKLKHMALSEGNLGAAKLLLGLRQELTEEHVQAHPEAMKALERAEQMFADDDSERLNRHSLEVFNAARRRTRKL